MIAQRAATTWSPWRSARSSAARTSCVFDGHSFVVDHNGAVIARAPQFAEDLLVCDVDPSARGPPACATPASAPRRARYRRRSPTSARSRTGAAPSDERPPAARSPRCSTASAEVYAALVLGTRDYVEKNGFKHVVLGLSGGIDSTLVALIAVDALGPERVTCVTMPSPYSSSGTRGDAEVLAANLGVELLELPIADAMDGYDELLGEPSRAASRTSPRRTSRRASAATC